VTDAPGAGALACDLAAHAALRVPLEAVPELRRQPGPPFGEPLPATFLKHADEQTVVGLAAVHQAIHDAGLRGSFRAWGALAAPRYLGRSASAVAIPRFLAEGAWGVSPHMIPHRSLHAVSGTLSQALKLHGPNFGVGGGPGCETELLLTGLSLLYGKQLPGVWIVLTRIGPEAPLGADGALAPGSFVEALALALAPARADSPGPRLRLRVRPAQQRASASPSGQAFGLSALVDLLRRLNAGEAPLEQELAWGAWMELTNLAARQANPEGPVLLPGPGTCVDRPAVCRWSA
jgi:hypothetical protein